MIVSRELCGVTFFGGSGIIVGPSFGIATPLTSNTRGLKDENLTVIVKWAIV